MKNDRENRSDEKGEGNNLEFDEKNRKFIHVGLYFYLFVYFIKET